MKQITSLLLSLALAVSISVQSLAAYEFESGASSMSEFGSSTSYDGTVTPDPMRENTRRNKDASSLPPPYFYGSGTIPTDPSSPFHDNLPSSGFVNGGQQLPPNGAEDYAPGINSVTTGFLPSTSQTGAGPSGTTVSTTPLYYDDGSIGTLYVEHVRKTIKVYEGEQLSNLAKGAGHFSSTSAWDGNVSLAGHNRGGAAYFSFVKDLEVGDRLTYTTLYGSRTYEVYSKTQVSETDTSMLNWTAGNELTLVTCVANVPELRYCAKAKEVK